MLAPSEAWQAKNADKMPIVTAYNAEVTAKAAAAQKSTTVAYKSDTAAGPADRQAVHGQEGALRVHHRGTAGAIVSSLAAVLNAASTIFAIDIYSEYINKQASKSVFVAIGRISVACLRGHRLRGGAVAGRSEVRRHLHLHPRVQGYVSPGVLAVFIFGLLNRTASGATSGVTGLLLNPVLYYLFKRYLPQLDFLNRMALCMIIVLAVMTVMGFVTRLPKPEWCSNPTRRSIWKVRKGAKWGHRSGDRNGDPVHHLPLVPCGSTGTIKNKLFV